MLINIEDVKSFLGITVTTDDDKMMPLCQSAQDYADGYCDRTLEGSTFIEYHDGDGTDIIQLRIMPVVSISSIYDDYDRVYGSDSLIASTDYAFNPATGIITRVVGVFMNGVNNVKITYVAGYGSGYTNLPYNLKQALIYLATAMYLEGKAGVQVFENQEIVYRPSYLKKEAHKILDGYRKILV